MVKRIQFLHENGEKAPAIHVITFYADREEQVSLQSNELAIDREFGLEKVAVHSLAGGHWGAVINRPFKSQSIRLKSLPADGPLGWWHGLVGIDRPDITRGKGVRVGVIDEGLEFNPNDDTLSHLTLLGDNELDYPVVGDTRLLPSTHHGNSIASLLFSRSTSATGYQGIAPGATAFFYGARLPKRFDANDRRRGLNPSLLASAIEDLSGSHRCDIIVVSAGDLVQDKPHLHEAIIDAKKRGTLCFFAAGNDRQRLLYPARYPEALAVGAIGKRGYAPEGVFEHHHDRYSAIDVCDGYYLWDGTALGPDLQFVAPGSNLVWEHYGKPADAVSGTSWAAPIAGGTAAAILSETMPLWSGLSRTAERWDAMMAILSKHSDRLNFDPAWIQFGMLKTQLRNHIVGATLEETLKERD